MALLSWNWLKRRVSAKKNDCCYFSHALDDGCGASPGAVWAADIVVETGTKNCSEPL